MSKPKKKNDPFVDELLPDEEVLWRGQPELTFLQFAKMKNWHWTILLILGLLLGAVIFLQKSIAGVLVILPAIFLIVRVFNESQVFNTLVSQRYLVTNQRLLLKEKSTLHIMRIDEVSYVVKTERIDDLKSLFFM